MSDRTHHYVSYETKIVNVSAVNLVGKLDVVDVDTALGEFPEWCLVEHDGKICRIEEWPGKFDGQHVRILIEKLMSRDESHLLGSEGE